MFCVVHLPKQKHYICVTLDESLDHNDFQLGADWEQNIDQMSGISNVSDFQAGQSVRRASDEILDEILINDNPAGQTVPAYIDSIGIVDDEADLSGDRSKDIGSFLTQAQQMESPVSPPMVCKMTYYRIGFFNLDRNNSNDKIWRLMLLSFQQKMGQKMTVQRISVINPTWKMPTLETLLVRCRELKNMDKMIVQIGIT